MSAPPSPPSSVASEFDAIALDFRGLVRIYLETWPYLRAELAHFLVLLGLIWALFGFGTAVGFLGFDILWDSVGQGQPISAAQAAIMALKVGPFVEVATLGTEARHELLIRFLILTAIITVLTTTVGSAIGLYKVWILQRVNQHLRARMVANAEELSLRFHGDARAGDAIYRVFQDSAMVTAVIDNIVAVPIIGISTLTMQIAIATLFSPWFGFLLCLGVIVLLVVLTVMTPRLRQRSHLARKANAALFTRVQETFQSIFAIKAYGYEASNSKRFSIESERALEHAFLMRRDFAVIKAVASFSLAIVLFATDYIATRYVLSDSPVFGASLLVLFGLSVTAWTVAAHQARRGSIEAASGTLQQLTSVWVLAQDMAVGLGRAFWLLNVEPEVKDPLRPIPISASISSISFDDVHFRYGERKVLKGVNLRAGVGTITAIVGPSGAGKSTLVSMLLRVFDPDQGRIRFNDTDLRDLSIASLRASIAIALQENVSFPVSVRENLLYAAPAEKTEAEILEACEVACAEFIEDLPQGLDTELGVAGARLSTGQKQRLSIARAILRDASVLILDEPTASLDAETEHRVLTRLKQWAKGRVVFLITHRAEAVRIADRIAFLEGGAIVESGTHESLMAFGRRYRMFVDAGQTDV